MRRKRIVLLSILMVFLLGKANGQQSQRKIIDSLKQVISLPISDTIRFISLGRIANAYSETNPDSTFYYAELTLSIIRKLNLKLDEAESLNEMGYAQTNLGNHPLSLQYILAAIDITTNPESEKNVLPEKYPTVDDFSDRTQSAYLQRIEKLSRIYQNAGILYENVKNSEKALMYYKNSVSVAIESKNIKTESNTYLTMGRAFIDLGKLDSALFSLQNAYKKAEESKHDRYLGSIILNMGRAYLRMGEVKKATELFNKAITESIKNEYYRGVVASNLELAGVYKNSGKLDSALYSMRAAQSYADYLNSPDLYLRIYAALTDYYKTLNVSDSVMKYQSLIIDINNNLIRLKQAQQFQNIDFNEIQRKQQIEAAKKTYQTKVTQYSLLAGLGAILLITIILYRNYRQKLKANKVLESTLSNLKSTQAQLIQSEKIATLAQKAEALRLKELDTVKTKLYTNITHEFRTPLTVILGVANQVLENPKEDKNKGLKMIVRNGQNLLTLVNQMLDLSKLESGKLSLQYHHADVISFLGYIVDSFHSLAESKGVQIHFISVKDQLNMDFDEVRLQQVVSNILSNAIKFTPKGGHVYVSTDVKNDSFILKVKDTGIGISEADLPHIFDRFYQADDSHTRHGEGTGIGLALTHELVKLMKGTIAVRSKEGQGSEFEVTLPIRTDTDSKKKTNQVPFLSMETKIEYPDSAEEDFHSSLISPSHSENGSPHVLIVDDNEDVLAFVASCLENEFDVEIAKNGQQCEDLAFKMIPDLIVMDVMMPFKDGFEVCKTLKTDERTSHIPIILLTAKADLESRLEGLEQGADDYLTKPFHKKELLMRIRNLLDLRQKLQHSYRLSLEESLPAIPLPHPDGSKNNSGFNSPKDAQAGNSHPSIPIASSLENAFVIKVRKTIESHLEEPDFDVEKLCRLLALSHSQVHRKLSALTGLSATHFIRYVRLIKAKELILRSGFSIAAIAYDCGFNDPAYFSRIFKQEFGMSPQVWREQNSMD